MILGDLVVGNVTKRWEAASVQGRFKLCIKIDVLLFLDLRYRLALLHANGKFKRV
jgi:hypothetical protein